MFRSAYESCLPNGTARVQPFELWSVMTRRCRIGATIGQFDDLKELMARARPAR